MVNDRVDGKRNQEDETMEFHDDIMITSVRMLFIKGGVWWAVLMLGTFKCWTLSRCDNIKVHDMTHQMEKE